MKRVIAVAGLAVAACGPPNVPVSGNVAGMPVDVYRPVTSRDLDVVARLKDNGLETKVSLSQVEPGLTTNIEVRILVNSPGLLPPGRGVDVNTNGVTAHLWFQRIGTSSLDFSEDALSGGVGFDKLGTTVGAAVEGWYQLTFPAGSVGGRFATAVQK